MIIFIYTYTHTYIYIYIYIYIVMNEYTYPRSFCKTCMPTPTVTHPDPLQLHRQSTRCPWSDARVEWEGIYKGENRYGTVATAAYVSLLLWLQLLVFPRGSMSNVKHDCQALESVSYSQHP